MTTHPALGARDIGEVITFQVCCNLQSLQILYACIALLFFIQRFLLHLVVYTLRSSVVLSPYRYCTGFLFECSRSEEFPLVSSFMFCI